MGKQATIAIVAAIVQFLATQSFAQDCPPPSCSGRPTYITVGFTPGSTADILARALAQSLGSAWSSAVVVENKAGAGGTIAASHVAKSAPDATICLLAPSSLNAASALYAKLDFSPEKDLIAAALVASAPFAIAVPANSDIRTVGDLVSRAKQSPGKLTYGSGGTGSLDNLSGEFFKSSTGINTTHVPYKGAGAAVTELLSGRIDYMMAAPVTVAEQARQGKLRILATTGQRRATSLQDIPTLAEAGVRGIDVENRYVLYVPRGTPQAALERWNRAVNRSLQSPEMKAFVERQGASVETLSLDTLQRTIASDTARWAMITKSAGIKPE
jgi:tripartite-type tricarboxylate transporter receptor subunit TctC